MHFLKSPLTWALLALGIWLNCEYNYQFMQVNGVDAVTTPMLFKQALIGSAALVAVVCGLAMLRGEKFEVSDESDSGKIKYAGLIIGGVLLFGVIFNLALNKDLLFVTAGGAFSGKSQAGQTRQSGGIHAGSNRNAIRGPVDDRRDYGRFGIGDPGLAGRAGARTGAHGWDRRVPPRRQYNDGF
jgi:hypothetical protein